VIGSDCLFQVLFPSVAGILPACLTAFGTWAIFPQLREIRLTIDLDASHYLYNISLLAEIETKFGLCLGCVFGGGFLAVF